jgi:hypothetical protein
MNDDISTPMKLAQRCPFLYLDEPLPLTRDKRSTLYPLGVYDDR